MSALTPAVAAGLAAMLIVVIVMCAVGVASLETVHDANQGRAAPRRSSSKSLPHQPIDIVVLIHLY